MKPKHIADFSSFLNEFQKETDRGAALVGAALIEGQLERLLIAHLVPGKACEALINGGEAPLGTLSARLKMAHALGLITELEFNEANLVRRIRNEFAHGLHGLTFANEKIAVLCRNLRANTPDGERCGGNPRGLFVNSVVSLSMALWYRPEYAEPFKAQPRTWSYQLSPERNS